MVDVLLIRFTFETSNLTRQLRLRVRMNYVDDSNTHG